MALRRGFLALALIAPAAAQAEGWIPYKFASPPKVEAEEVQVGADAAGNVAAIWRNDTDFKDPLRDADDQLLAAAGGRDGLQRPNPSRRRTGVGSPRLGVPERRRCRRLGTQHRQQRHRRGSDPLARGLGRRHRTDRQRRRNRRYLTIELTGNGRGLVAWRTPKSPYRNKIRLINGGTSRRRRAPASPPRPTPQQGAGSRGRADDGLRFLLGDKENPSNPGQLLNLYTQSGLSWTEGTRSPAAPCDPGRGRPKRRTGRGLDGRRQRTLKRDTGPGEAVTVANPAGLSYLALAVGPATEEFPNGMALVAWLQFVDDGTHACCDQIRAAVGDGFTMAPPLELSDELEDVKGFPYAAVGPDGSGTSPGPASTGASGAAGLRPAPGGSFRQSPTTSRSATPSSPISPSRPTAGPGRPAADRRSRRELYWRAAVSITNRPAAAEAAAPRRCPSAGLRARRRTRRRRS